MEHQDRSAEGQCRCRQDCATPCHPVLSTGLSRSLSPIAAFDVHPTAQSFFHSKNILGFVSLFLNAPPGSPSDLTLCSNSPSQDLASSLKERRYCCLTK